MDQYSICSNTEHITLISNTVKHFLRRISLGMYYATDAADSYQNIFDRITWLQGLITGNKFIEVAYSNFEVILFKNTV